MTWFDKDGEVQADVLASDWATALEWILNYAKNDSYNMSMPAEMIVGAQEYYDYTKELAESEGNEAAKALTADEGSKFAEMVGIACDDEAGTITYTLVDKLSYFPSVATYNCMYPLSATSPGKTSGTTVRMLYPTSITAARKSSPRARITGMTPM